MHAEEDTSTGVPAPEVKKPQVKITWGFQFWREGDIHKKPRRPNEFSFSRFKFLFMPPNMPPVLQYWLAARF